MEFKDHPLWRFTLKAHGRRGVHEACVDLQKNHSIDVNFLFWCCWVAQMGAPSLDEAQMRRAMAAVGPWQEEIVRPVWRARWKLKPSYGNFPEDLTEALRQQLIAAEINAEHLEMLQLADAVEIRIKETVSTWEKVFNAMENVKRHLTLFFEENAKNEFPKSIQSPLNTILCACFPELKKEQISDILSEHHKK
ncbi:MAG: TIGR02444 family protein [Deltaproteobacteria bacterium]|nr:TIGR02444 family protein [Deltaproteobacteria bacterium]